MELCPLCHKMTAEKSHYTGVSICYNRFCNKDWLERMAREEEVPRRKNKYVHKRMIRLGQCKGESSSTE